MAIEIKPQPGPQTDFLSSRANIVIYGGAAGGGKTYSLLMEPLRHYRLPGFNAVIFRKTLADVKKAGSLWDTSFQVYSQFAFPRLGSLSWEFQNGGKVTFAHLERYTDTQAWMGSQIPLLCCEIGTPVLMADGSYKTVESLVIGDLVSTLRGPRAIIKTFSPIIEQCVKAIIYGHDGEIIGSQVHAVNHKVLTPYGWFSYDDMFYGFRLSLISASKKFHFAHKFSGMSGRQFQFDVQLHDSQLYHPEPRLELSQLSSDRQFESVNVFYKGQPSQENCCELFVDKYQELLRQPSIRLSVILSGQHHVEADHTYAHAQYYDDNAYVLFWSSPLNYQGDYRFLSHFYDEHLNETANSLRANAQQLNDVVVRIPKNLPLDDRGKVQEYILSDQLQYVHPYTGEELTAKTKVSFGSCDMIPCGNRFVVHFSVEDENHYITKFGLVNKNCFDELTHFDRDTFFYMLSRNRATIGIRPYVRCTTNPDSDSWVAEFLQWWINQDTGFAIPERANQWRWFARIGDIIEWADTQKELIKKFGHSIRPKSVTFIPAKLTDNKILMEADPGYEANLMALQWVERQRLLEGNWKIRPSAGLYFRRDWCKTIDIIPAHTEFVRGWDLAATEKTHNNDPDSTCGTKIGRMPDGRFLVAHHLRMQESPSKVERRLLNTASQDGKNCRIHIPQDPGSAGKAQVAHLARLLEGYECRFKPASGDKLTRFSAFSAQAEAGNVLVYRASWNEAWFTQLENFPDSKHDDDVDSTSEAFNGLLGLDGKAGQAIYELEKRRALDRKLREEEEEETNIIRLDRGNIK